MRKLALPKGVPAPKHKTKEVIELTAKLKTQKLMALEDQISSVWSSLASDVKHQLISLLAKWGGAVDGAVQVNQSMRMLGLNDLQIDLNDIGQIIRKISTVEIANILLRHADGIDDDQKTQLSNLIIDSLNPNKGDDHAARLDRPRK